MFIAKAMPVGSSKFILALDDFLVVSPFFFESFNLKLEGNKKNTNNESIIKECGVCKSLYKISGFL